MNAPVARRFDWLFLLPPTVDLPADVAVVVGGSEELANGLISTGLAKRWTHAGPSTEPGQLVVAWDDAEATIDEIAKQIAPGGTAVIEVDRRRRGRRSATLGNVERRLERSGCHLVSAHVVSPTLAEPRRLLPIDSPGAVRWHLRTLFIAATPASAFARAVLSAICRTPVARRVLGAVMPRLLIVCTRATLREPDERVIVLTSGYDPGSRTVVLPFARCSSTPSRVVKVATSDVSAAATTGEHARLAALHDALPWELRRALPAPIALTTVAGRTACVQSCASGPSLNTLAGSCTRSATRKRRDLMTVVDWLDEFAVATRVSAGDGEHHWTGIYEQAATSLALDADVDADVYQLLSLARQRAHDSGLADVAVHQHFDAGPWNVNVGRRTLMLVDWETDAHRPADSLGPPLADVLYLVMYWYFLVCRATTPGAQHEAFVRLFVTRLPADDNVVAARRAIDAALRAVALERRCVPAALTALWAERAVYTAARRQAFGAISPGEATEPVTHLRILAAAREDLFTLDGWYAFAVGTEVVNDHPSRRSRAVPIRG